MTRQETLLAALSRFGYLRNADIAKLLFNDNASGLRIAQQLTKTLVNEKRIIEQKLKGRASHYALPGYERLFMNMTGHRDAANEIAINFCLAGHDVVTEREIQTTSTYTFFGKIPDALVLDRWTEELGAPRLDYTWIEVENAERSGRDVISFGNWIMRIFTAENGNNWHTLPAYLDGHLATVIVVIASKKAEKIKDRLLSYIVRAHQADAEWMNSILSDRLKFLSFI